MAKSKCFRKLGRSSVHLPPIISTRTFPVYITCLFMHTQTHTHTYTYKLHTLVTKLYT